MTKQGKTELGKGAVLLSIAVLLALTALPNCASTSESQMMPDANETQLAKPALDSNNVMTRPEGYRKWVYIGTPLTPNELNPPEAPFPEFHNVYIHPEDFAHYEETGEFQDGTVLVKELVSIGSKQASSGLGYFMGDFIGLEAAMKDSRRFPDEPGYWAYFSFGHSYPLMDTTKPQDATVCNACHAKNAEEDWVFTQYYPVVRAAKPASSSD